MLIIQIFIYFHWNTHSFRRDRLQDFCSTAPQKCEINLKLPLLRRNPATQTLEVNFDEQLVEVLREVHYLLLLGSAPGNETPRESGGMLGTASPTSSEFLEKFAGFGSVEDIKQMLPPQILAVHDRAEPLREARLKLNQIVEAYNAVRLNTLTVEYPLIAEEVDAFDDRISPAFKQMSWEESE
ncbi:unnamed protein product [Protopolystoma xenopodis]|uniref:Dynein heavy chain tail domain-containing protein n=1 Tax=Protopolystoma xenopodis TaxID=117903 RepID=A0A3S4ZTE1_9PLAT|nr:unnamed protein product [Protopolystoma xenopodis]